MGNGSLRQTVFLSCLFLFFNSFPLLCSAADRITQGQSIRDGETIISSGNDFALGFFTPGSSTNRYVGIWYNKIPIQTVVWVANREKPVSNSSGVLTVGNDGNLRLFDGSGTSIWSTNISSTPPINSTAILTDTGNLLLSGEEVDDPEKALWQSFEDPGDTFLPGMRAGLNSRNGVTHLYSSWKSENDPSKGNFTLGVDPNGLPQIVIWENLKRRWRSGLWNGQVFIGVPDMRPRFLFGFKLSDLGGRMYFTYTVLDDSDILRFHMKWDGTEEQLRWDDEKKEWFRFWSQPVSECQIYNKCGAFANCDMSNSQMCSCLRGFQPKSTTQWSRRNWSSGCVRKTELQCERNASAAKVKGDGFFQLNGVKLPDNSVWKKDYNNGNQCENYCLGNCSCKAYAFVSGIGCLTWGVDLVDIQQFQQNGNTLYLRLANSELGRKKIIATWVIVPCVVLGVLILCISAYFLWKRKANSRDSRRKSEKETMVVDVNKSREIWKDFSEKHDIGEGNEGSGADLPLLSFESLVTATNNFSDANMLGEGGFGSVYKGQVPGGKELAVKRLSRMSGQGVEEFKNEIILIAKLQHRNLVRLLGCCIEGEEKLLVYEYLPNKSLDAFIFDSTMRAQLDWQKRFNILEGIARGLLYLHRDSRLRIIHRDLKASNILLDDEMNPKISDFGMAKIFGGSENQDNTNRVVGTYGYMAPEYAMEGLFSIKSDVYSFGVLLLEIISGKKNMKYCHPEYPLNLLGYVWKLWNEERTMDIIDTCIRDSCPQGDVLRCIQVGLLCVQDSAMDRPTMSSVVLMLESKATVLPTPRQATFTIERRHVEMDLSIGSSETTSKNDVTGTMITGR